MSLYRVASRRGRLGGLLLPAIVLVLGLTVGFLVGRASADEPSLAEALDAPAAHVEDARNALDVLTIEYPQAVEETTEYEAALADDLQELLDGESCGLRVDRAENVEQPRHHDEAVA